MIWRVCQVLVCAMFVCVLNHFTYLCKSRQIFLATDISTLYKSAPTTGVSPVHGTGASVIGYIGIQLSEFGQI